MNDIIIMSPGVIWTSITAGTKVKQDLRSVLDISAYCKIEYAIYVYKAPSVITVDFYTNHQNVQDDKSWEGIQVATKGGPEGSVLTGEIALVNVPQRFLRWVIGATTGTDTYAVQIVLTCSRCQ